MAHAIECIQAHCGVFPCIVDEYSSIDEAKTGNVATQFSMSAPREEASMMHEMALPISMPSDCVP
jgi:hypothetical protein